MSPPVLDAAAALDRARALAQDGRRRLIGVVGPPGAGKTTLAQHVVDALPGAAAVPMDGFHLADVQLAALGRSDRKGAADTFDGWGYLALLERLRTAAHTVYAPAFERELEQPVAGAIAVDPAASLVVTEGNYLLLDTPPWTHVAAALDEVWWVEVDDEVRRHRLIARHVRFGKSPQFAQEWVAAVDDVNARLVAAGRERADVIVREETVPPPRPR